MKITEGERSVEKMIDVFEAIPKLLINNEIEFITLNFETKKAKGALISLNYGDLDKIIESSIITIEQAEKRIKHKD